MANNSIIPNLSYWNCDKYPYFIPAIKDISRISHPIDTDMLTYVTSDELHCVLNGSAEYEIITPKNNEHIFLTAEKNDILFFPCGVQYYKIHNPSENYEFLKIGFFIYTCTDTLPGKSNSDINELLSSPIQNRKMYINLPRISKFNHEDDAHYHISHIAKEYNSRKPEYVLQTQTQLLQLLLALFHSNKNRHSDVLKNINVIGITSKSNPYTVIPKNCIISFSDFEIFSSNPHSNRQNAKVLSVFNAHDNYKLNPDNDDLIITTANYNDMSTVKLHALKDTVYHIWLYPDKNTFTPDLREYIRSGYIRFYAKCNIEMMFGIVIYNHENHRYINHTFNITPGNNYTEYCIPLLESDNESATNPHIHKIITFIEQNYDRKIKLEDIASHIHLNPSYISILFKEQMGISISDYILNYRLSVAKKLLINSKESSINDIALQVGFFDAAHFTKTFKMHYSITPKDYRNNNN